MSKLNRIERIEKAADRVDVRYCTNDQLKRLIAGESPLRVLEWNESGDPIYELDEPAPRGN